MTDRPTWRDAYTAEQMSMATPPAGNGLAQIPPAPPMCGARNGYPSYCRYYNSWVEHVDEIGRYTCTRPAGHQGDHHHATPDGVVAAWKDQLFNRRALAEGGGATT